MSDTTENETENVREEFSNSLKKIEFISICILHNNMDERRLVNKKSHKKIQDQQFFSCFESSVEEISVQHWSFYFSLFSALV